MYLLMIKRPGYTLEVQSRYSAGSIKGNHLLLNVPEEAVLMRRNKYCIRSVDHFDWYDMGILAHYLRRLGVI